MKESIPGIIRWGKDVVDVALKRVSAIPDQAAHGVVRGLLGWVPEREAETVGVVVDPFTRERRKDQAGVLLGVPATAAAGRSAPVSPADPATSRFVDAEEISWLESGRHELPFRRDKLWALPQMWWEMALGGVGAGTYLAGLARGNRGVMALGWGMQTFGKGALLAADLGRPERFWRVFAKPRTSWISRGAWAYSAFAVAGGLSLISKSGSARAFGALGAAVVGLYDGLFLHQSKGVPAWANPIIPAFFGAGGLAGGAHVANALKPDRGIARAAVCGSVANAVAGGLYAWSLTRGDVAERLSARDLLEGVQKQRFATLGLIGGSLLPAVLGSKRSTVARAVAGAFAAGGVLHIRRAVLQAGIHAPVMNPPRAGRNPIDSL